ncbi:hypothetical protein [Clostridium sp.]|nr:hypothetical protein [Clostridium sp.]
MYLKHFKREIVSDISTFGWTQQNKLHTLIGEINSVTIVDAVNTIIW